MTTNDNLNVDDLSPLERIALRIALIPPERQGASTFAARIPWAEIDELRVECDRIGFDWREAHRRYEAITNERARARP